MNALLTRHTSRHAISRGIYYYGTPYGEIVPITRDEILTDYVIIENFIVGVSRFGLLRPIYDRSRRMVIVRLPDFNNTPLTAQEAQILPYNDHWLPTPLNGERDGLRLVGPNIRSRQK